MHMIEQATTQQKYQAIWGVVRRVPKGKVATYSQIAAIAGLPGRARMVGKALGAVLEQQEMPWYRIIRADGRIAFASDTLQGNTQKTHLLNEQVEVVNMRVRLKTYQWQPESLW